MGIYNSNCDLNKYKIFYAVAECNSFSKASEILHISQPAVSYAIKELESQLETKLFIRDNKNVKLTEVGEKLMFYIQNAFNNIVMAESLVKESCDNTDGIIKIGIYSHISLFMLPEIIEKFSKKYPKARFSIYTSSTNEMKEMLKHQQLDFIVAQYPVFINDNTFKEEILCEMENCFFGSKEYHNISNIKDNKVILPFGGYVDIDLLQEKFKRNNIIIDDNFRCYNTELLKRLVKNGIGIGWGLKKSIEKELNDNEFFEIPVDFELSKTIFSITYDENFMSDTSLKFIEYFKDEIKNYI